MWTDIWRTQRNYLNIAFDYQNKPQLDEQFIPFRVWEKAYLAEAEHPFAVAVEREDGKVTVFETRLRSGAFAEAKNDKKRPCIVRRIRMIQGRYYLHLGIFRTAVPARFLFRYSHSMVPVGLGVRSKSTRLMPSTSEVMRLTILCSTG